MTTLEDLEKQAGIDSDTACKILGNPQSITLDENFTKACKLGVISIRLIQREEENAKSTS